MENIEKYQKQLLEQTQSLYRDTPISEATQQAYLATPRHRFVRTYREWGTKGWNVVEANTLAEQIATLYADRSDAMNRSLVVAKDDWLITYGNTQAEERLLKGLRHWVELGMPTAACLKLKVFPIGAQLRAGDNQWLVKRRDSQFLWSL